MTSFNEKNRFEVLDGMRGVAAFLVMIYHYTLLPHVMFINANLAVDVFFMLSGFVLFYSYAGRLTQEMSFSAYVERRFIRLYPLFFLGLMTGTIVSCFYIQSPGANCAQPNIFSSFLSNIFFVPFLEAAGNAEEHCRFSNLIFPANTPSWSLFFEMAASLAFPYLVSLKQATLARFTAACFAMIIAGAVFSKLAGYSSVIDYNAGWNTTNILQGFPRVFYGFTFGMVIALFIDEIKAHPLGIWITEKIRNKELLVYLGLTVMLLLPFTLKYTYYLWCIGLVAPVLVICGALTKCENRTLSSLSSFLGWLSYPVYCLHVPIYDGLTLVYQKYGFARAPLLLVSIVVTVVVSIFITKLYDEPLRAYLTTKAKRQALGRGILLPKN